MSDQKETISTQSIILFYSGIVIVALSIGLLVIGGWSGVKNAMTPVVDFMKAQPTPAVSDNPVAMPQYKEGTNYNEDSSNGDLDTKDKLPNYGGVKLDMPQPTMETVEDVENYPQPTLHPWEPGGTEWQKEYWDEDP